MKVFVYYNLHKKTFSIKDTKTNLVVNHSDMVVLKNGEFKVSQAGRARVLKEKRKNVHAGVIGTLCLQKKCKKVGRFTYNPYLYNNFIDIETKQDLFNSDTAKFSVSKNKPNTLWGNLK